VQIGNTRTKNSRILLKILQFLRWGSFFFPWGGPGGLILFILSHGFLGAGEEGGGGGGGGGGYIIAFFLIALSPGISKNISYHHG
jgi:hypothetical protein